MQPLEPVPMRHAWYYKLGIFLFIIVCFEVGAFLTVFPWTQQWDSNSLARLLPWLRGFWTSSYFRGALSGLGVVNIYISIAELLRRQPVMVIRRVGIFELIEIFLERALLIGAASQLEHHVLHREFGGYRAAIISRRRFGTRIPRERHHRIIVDRGSDERRRCRAATECRSHAGK